MECDPVLQAIVDASLNIGDATDGRVDSPIILNVGGMIVSGRIISAREFMLSDPLTNAILEEAEKLNPSSEGIADISLNDGPNYIHLSGARFFTPGLKPAPANDNIYWRGRIADVSGFSFGRIVEVKVDVDVDDDP